MTTPNPALTNATAAWYQAVCKALDLSTDSFQLIGGQGIPLGEDAQAVWALADTVPATAAVANATDYIGSRTLFSASYGALLTNLQDPTPSPFQQALGEDYDTWIDYVRTYKFQAGDTYASVFSTWAMQQGITPSQIDADVEMLNTDTPLTQALSKYNAAVAAKKAFAYNFTLQMITNGLAESHAVPVDIQSTAAAASLSDTWAHGRADVWWGLFGGQSTSTYEQTSQTVAQAGMSISGQFDHAYVLPVLPLYEASDDPFLANYLPWYSSAAVSMAYENNDNQVEVWRTGEQGGWTEFFGPNGSMSQAVTELVIVDGMNFTISSSVSLTQDDQTNLQHASEGGFFPFFAGEGQAAVSTTVASASSSGFSVTVSAEPGNPLLLGFTVEPASSYTT